MKKISCLILALSAFAGSASAQFYVKLGAGYAIPQAAQTFDGTGQVYNGTQHNTTYTQTYTVKPASFSAGVQGFLGIGYMFSEHVGVELNGNIGIKPKKYTYSIDSIMIGGVESKVSVVQQAKSPFVLMPALVLQTGGDKLNLYTRFGLALPLSNGIKEDQVITNLPGAGAVETDDFTFNIKNSFSLGFAAAAGVRYKLSDKLSLWGEVSLLSMSVYVKEADLTNVTANGQYIPLSQVSGPQKIKYSRNATVDSNQTVQPAYSQPFSNIGFNVGLSFTLGEKRQRGNHRMNSDEGEESKKPFRRR